MIDIATKIQDTVSPTTSLLFPALLHPQQLVFVGQRQLLLEIYVNEALPIFWKTG